MNSTTEIENPINTFNLTKCYNKQSLEKEIKKYKCL